MFSLILLFCMIGVTSSNPQLLKISIKNQCIKQIVYQFITSHTCEKLSQSIKSQLAVKMTNCLFKQMGKQQICGEKDLEISNTGKGSNCKLEGDSWNTFTVFFAHIDNLCHFYWDLSKSERADQMIDALLQSSKRSLNILNQNTQSTKQILQLQMSLRLQILSSIATQQQMSMLLSNSSNLLTSITSELTSSLNKIHSDIKQNYSVISRILSGVNQVLKNIDILYGFLAAEANSIQGVLFFGVLVLVTFGGCLLNQKFRIRRNQCLIVICMHFLVEFFLGRLISIFINIQLVRCSSVALLGIIVLSAKPAFNGIEKTLNAQLNSERMSRIMNKALRNHFQEIKSQILVEKNKKLPRSE